MQIDVNLFGPLAEIAASDVITVKLEGDANASGVLQAIHASSPELRPALATCRLAVNHDYALPEDEVTPRDEVALIGMVSGG